MGQTVRDINPATTNALQRTRPSWDHLPLPKVLRSDETVDPESFTKISSFNGDPQTFRAHLDSLGLSNFIPIDLKMETGPTAPLAQPIVITAGKIAPNSFVTQPMEGANANPDGTPTENTFVRWADLGESGAGINWTEAMSVAPEGLAPRQLLINESTYDHIARLVEHLLRAHESRFGSLTGMPYLSKRPILVAQPTHSGRHSIGGPLIPVRNPVFDRRNPKVNDGSVISDDYLKRLEDAYVIAAKVLERAGYDGLDVKLCHFYLLGELLGAKLRRNSIYGGSFENRTRFFRNVAEKIKANTNLFLAVRISATDFVPFKAREGDKAGIPEETGPEGYPFAFGGDDTGLGINLNEFYDFLDLCVELGVKIVNVSVGNPYGTAFLQRATRLPPKLPPFTHEPPNDPIIDVARAHEICALALRYRPELIYVNSENSYLEDMIPFAAQAARHLSRTHGVGLGRAILTYWDMPADILLGNELDTKRICRGLSLCTDSRRAGFPTTCPLEARARSEVQQIRLVMKSMPKYI